MSKKVFISIIVPVYKVEKYIHQCVDSILAQDFSDFEVVLVDDGSPDGCPVICDEYARQNKNIKAIHQPNGGQSKARKAGLKAAGGEYVWFVDSDDWLEPGALQTVYNSATKNDADIVTFDAYFNYSDHRSPVGQSVKSGCFDKKGLIKNIYPKMIYGGKFFYFGIYAAMWNKVFRRSILTPNIMSVDEKIKIGEDGVTTFATFLDAKKVCILGGKRLYNYRDNNYSITRSYCAEQFDGAKLLIQSLRDINAEKAVYNLNEQIDYYLMYNVYSIFLEEFYYRYQKSFAARYRYLRDIFYWPEVVAVAKKMSTVGMSADFRLFFGYFQAGAFKRVMLLTIFIAMRKRLKLFVKKILKRY